MSFNIGIIGSGHMGRSLAVGIAQNPNLEFSLKIADHNEDNLQGYTQENIQTTLDNREAVADSQIAILAVRPQDTKSVMLEIAPFIEQDQVVISIAAGVPMSHLESWLPQSTAIIHAMPNIPVMLGRGVTGLFANASVDNTLKAITEMTFESVGDTVWLEKDEHVDIVTAVSGSGPAYFFYLMDAMIQAAVELGIDEKAAKELTIETALGAAEIAKKSSESPALLCESVASPGGTTESALNTMNNKEVRKSIIQAVKSAHTRSIELTASL